MNFPLLKVCDLKKIYQKKRPFTAVDAISFQLNPGEILGLLGPNGSGKTTTIQMLLGTLSSTSGSIEYFGLDFKKHRSEILQKVAFASTYTQLLPLLTLEENLVVIGYLYGLNKKETLKRTAPLLERFDLSNKLKARTSALSAGQSTRLTLIKSLFIEPKILLLDEPTASLDPDMAQEVLDVLLERQKESGLSILFTSHKMHEATQLCDRVIFLKRGKIIANEEPSILAKKSGAFRLILTLASDLEKMKAFIVKEQYKHQIEGSRVEIELTENEIPSFLNILNKKEISYANIQIKEPSLEDYFLHISRAERK